MCEALSVTPEHLIFGETGTPFTPTPSPLTAVAPSGDSEHARISRLVLTGVLLNALPTHEAKTIVRIACFTTPVSKITFPKTISRIGGSAG